MMISSLGSFHFLRPGWLLTLLPLGLILWAGWRQSATARWQSVVAPHLLEHLIERPQGRWAVKPFHLIVTVCLITAIALAGPTWRQEPSPFTEDTAPLIIALELTPYMLANDVQPSRLERAKLKVLDLVRLRGGARTGLLVWAGSAHLVVPLTNDPAAIEAFVADLEPSLMPVEGREPVAALERASELFDRDGTPGTLLFITAGLPERAIAHLRSFTDQRRDQLQVLAVATTAGGQMPSGEFSSLDRSALEKLKAETGAVVTLFTVDDSDVERISRLSTRHLLAVQQEDPGGRWRDEGWWLLWPIALVTAFWFRKGWLVQWETG